MRTARRGFLRYSPDRRPIPLPLGAVAAALAALVLAGPAALAQAPEPRACALDLQPAATLLLPYFEVELGDPHGRTTLFSLVNSSSAGKLASVTLWTDHGVPTLHFHVYLTGYDVQSVNLRDVFGGTLPATAPTGQDPGDQLSPRGDFSQDASFPNCTGLMPPPPLSADLRASLAAAHTGAFAGHLGGCAGQQLGDGLARGYVTVDVVRTCTLRIPGDAGYFATGGLGDASAENVLWGDFFLVDPGGNFAQSEPLVRVQAFPGRFAAGQPTFYGSLIGGSAADEREPLATSWAARFLQRGDFTGGTDLLVWRDPGGRRTPFGCGNAPPGFPRHSTTVPFDEQENPELFHGCPILCPPIAPPTPFPAATNRVSMADAPVSQEGFGSPMPTAFDFGWLHVQLYGESPQRSQGWVGQLMTASSRYSVGLRATPLDTTCAPAGPLQQ